MSSDKLFADHIMNSATFKIIRQFLGLTAPEVAKACNVTLRTARRWEASHTPPTDAVQWLHAKWDEMSEYVHATLRDLETPAAQHGPEQVTLTAYRTDEAAAVLPAEMSKEQHTARLGAILFLSANKPDTDITITFAENQQPANQGK